VTTEGFVAFLPASQEGTGALERVTMTSGAGPVGQPAFAVIVVVTEPAGGVEGGADEAEADEAGLLDTTEACVALELPVAKYDEGQEPGCAGLQPPGMLVGTGVEMEATEYWLCVLVGPEGR
jgi:hypothetical protein